jgi:hypothetical protein
MLDRMMGTGTRDRCTMAVAQDRRQGIVRFPPWHRRLAVPRLPPVGAKLAGARHRAPAEVRMLHRL